MNLLSATIFLTIFLSCQQPKAQKGNWTSLNDYFQVYAFSDKVMGLTIELGELDYPVTVQNLIVNSIFEKYSVTDSLEYTISQQVKSCLPVDINGKFRFFRNINLEDSLLNSIDKRFFVYCTKGIVERDIKDVVFSADACISNVVVFRFDKIDTSKYGHPILCTRKKLQLQYGNFPTVNKEVEIAEQKNKGDYSDSVKSVVFAKMDSLYFGYNDTFNWNDLTEKENSSLYPGRFIITLRGDSIYSKWSVSMDLFGIPCD